MYLRDLKITFVLNGQRRKAEKKYELSGLNQVGVNFVSKQRV